MPTYFWTMAFLRWTGMTESRKVTALEVERTSTPDGALLDGGSVPDDHWSDRCRTWRAKSIRSGGIIDALPISPINWLPRTWGRQSEIP